MQNFSDLYVQVRNKENRIYNDEEVRELPYLKVHQHSKEWNIRAKNAELLRNYIQKRYKNSLNIIEIGSGNGWLSYFLAQIPNSYVTGIEINEYELEQAKRLFNSKNLVFHSKNLTEIDFSQYNIVIFAASVQYFEQPQNIFNLVFTQNSYINIICMDTFWYKNEQQAMQAKQRTKKYYTELGFPQMAECYYHHTFEVLKPYTFQVLNESLFYKIMLKLQGLPFMPCISIQLKNNK